MSKTPERLAEEYGWPHYLTEDSGYAMRIAKDAFLAGYQAAKEQQEKEYGALVSKSKVAMQTLNDQLADVSKVIIPKENCEAELKAMQSAQELSEQAITWMKTSLPASERCNQCACEGYRAGYQAAAPQWISVKDRLPENSFLTVLVDFKVTDSNAKLFSLGYYERSENSSGEWYVQSNSHREKVEVTHWMPLPNPPEE